MLRINLTASPAHRHASLRVACPTSGAGRWRHAALCHAASGAGLPLRRGGAASRRERAPWQTAKRPEAWTARGDSDWSRMAHFMQNFKPTKIKKSKDLQVKERAAGAVETLRQQVSLSLQFWSHTPRPWIFTPPQCRSVGTSLLTAATLNFKAG